MLTENLGDGFERLSRWLPQPTQTLILSHVHLPFTFTYVSDEQSVPTSLEFHEKLLPISDFWGFHEVSNVPPV